MGTILQIVGVITPQSAEQGEQVEVVVRVKNVYSAAVAYVAVTGSYGTTPLPQEVWTPVVTSIEAQQTVDFATVITMPNKSISVNVGAWYYGTDGVFHLNDQKSVNITLGTEEPPNGEEPPDEEEKSKIPWATLLGIGAATLLGVVLVSKK